MSERTPDEELEAFFGPRPHEPPPIQPLGIVVGGSLSKGLDVKLDRSTVIEEAHKFLDPAVARHTIFGTIARELRKYNVTLLIVDQRPSGIDPEVMSQIGTRVTCLLDDETDIRADFSGISGAGALREVLARLDTRQQALILGHAVPMPVVVRTRTYGTPEFYTEMGGQEEVDPETVLARGRAILRGEDEIEL